MSDLISREYMKSLGATCIASRSKDGNMFPIVSIDELPPADLTHPTPSNTLGALDCVERQAAMKIRFSSGFDHDGILFVPYRDVVEHLKKLPSVQPRRGKWIEGRDERFVKCSECGMESTKNALMGIALFGEKEPHFCPNCGSYNGGDTDEVN